LTYNLLLAIVALTIGEEALEPMRRFLMKKLLGITKRRIDGRTGYDFVKYQEGIPVDFDQDVIQIIHSVKPYTMTTPERLFALIQAVKYIVKNNIPGDIVECGVWKGGSMMTVAKTLLDLGHLGRQLYLFDTFEGMTKPQDVDVSYREGDATKKFEKRKITENSSRWAYATLAEVERAMYETGYDREKISFVKGKVEETIPDNAPQSISLLRLDTDWYESTRHELIHLYPRLSHGGVIIIDDYGHWLGARKAVDEYIEQNNI
jgi:hypothetical protein